MSFSKFLDSRRGDCVALVRELKKRFDYVSVLGSDVKALNVRVNKKTSAISDATDADCGFVIKLWRGGAFFEYSLDDIAGDKEELALRIESELRVPEKYEGREISSRPLCDEPLEKSFRRLSDFDKYDEKDILRACEKARDLLLAADENVVNAMALVRTLEVSKLFVSENRTLDQNYTWVNGILVVNYREGDRLIGAREGVASHNLAYALSSLPLLADKLIDKARHLVKATPIEPGVYDVITDPSVTGLLAHEAFGHGVEMDMFVKDRAQAKNFIGKQVASPICNMRDGAGAALSVASYYFDDDGVLAHDTQIIKDGVLVAGISDIGSASQLGTEPTGNGRRESHKRKAYTRMTNTFFERGEDKLSDMIASIKHGYMIFETNNGMEDPKNWQVQCVAEYGREIVDGKLTDNYVAPVVMSGYVPDVLKSISMISDDFSLEGAGSCGKGHKEWVRVSDGGPALKLKVRLG